MLLPRDTMDKIKSAFWEVGPLLSTAAFKTGESIESPVIKTPDGEIWWLDFFPAGDEDNPDSLVFWLNRNEADRAAKVIFEIQFCFYDNPVRQYTLRHVFEEGEDVHKWVVDDVKNLAELRIYVPPSDLCFMGYLTVDECDDTLKPRKSIKNGADISENE